jgi:hypothetical protein
MECGLNLRGSAKFCPTCGTRRVLDGYRKDAGEVNASAPVSVVQPEMMIAQAHLKPGHIDVVDGSDGPEQSFPPRTHRAAVLPAIGPPARNKGLAIWALLLGIVSVCSGLLGQGWFGILAAVVAIVLIMIAYTGDKLSER